MPYAELAEKNFVVSIRCTTLLPSFFSEIRCFIVKNWLYIYDSKYCWPSLATTFSHLSGSVRIPRRKNWSSFEARHKSTIVSMGLCWQMPKFIVWRLWSIYFDHHLPLKPSIGKRRKQSCTPNNKSINTIKIVLFGLFKSNYLSNLMW